MVGFDDVTGKIAVVDSYVVVTLILDGVTT